MDRDIGLKKGCPETQIDTIARKGNANRIQTEEGLKQFVTKEVRLQRGSNKNQIIKINNKIITESFTIEAGDDSSRRINSNKNKGSLLENNPGVN